MVLLTQIEGFVEIAQRGNLSRAAEALHVTQPALTARIHALEGELGGPLFVRGRRGMQLTDAGRAKHAEMLRAVQAFNQRLLAGFSADELDELQALLGKLEQNARADSELRA